MCLDGWNYHRLLGDARKPLKQGALSRGNLTTHVLSGNNKGRISKTPTLPTSFDIADPIYAKNPSRKAHVAIIEIGRAVIVVNNQYAGPSTYVGKTGRIAMVFEEHDKAIVKLDSETYSDIHKMPWFNFTELETL
jgi:hypothetical protein